MELEELGRIVSDRVLGGIPLEGRSDHIRDEIPAIYTKRAVLGMRFVLLGAPDDEGFYLEGESRTAIKRMSPDEIRKSLFDISSIVAELLNGVNEIKVIAK